MEEEFYSYANAEHLADELNIAIDIATAVYRFWTLKRKVKQTQCIALIGLLMCHFWIINFILYDINLRQSNLILAFDLKRNVANMTRRQRRHEKDVKNGVLCQFHAIFYAMFTRTHMKRRVC